MKILLPGAYLLLISIQSAIAGIPVASSVVLGNQRINIPSAVDLEDYTATPKGQEVAAAMIEPYTQLLSIQAQHGLVHRFFVVKIDKEMISQSLSVPNFRIFTKHSRDQLGKQKQYSDLANLQAKEQGPKMSKALVPGQSLENLKFDAPVVIAVERDDDIAFTDTKLVPMKASVNGKPTQVNAVMCSSLILVKGKLVMTQLYAPQEDTEWARAACRKFVADIAGQNK